VQADYPAVKIATVSGDDVLELLRADVRSGLNEDQSRNLDTGRPLSTIANRLTTANAYLGALPIAEALDRGADIVITGRVADPSLTVAACMHHFRWSANDWNRLAGATVAGHLIECGTQVTGGISTDWLYVPAVDRIGFPIAEVMDDGTCIITKACGSGGWVTESTVKEQLLYEIGDPGRYLSPDVTVSFLSLDVKQQSPDRIRVVGATGRPAPDQLKVSVTWQNGYRAAGQLTMFGDCVVQKARRAADVVLGQLQRSGISFRETIVELIGAQACHPERNVPLRLLQEVMLRIAVADDSRDNVERFSRAMMPLITAGPPGTTGYAEGRPRVHPHYCFWPCLIDRSRIRPSVGLLPSPPEHAGTTPPIQSISEHRGTHPLPPGVSDDSSAPARTLTDLPEPATAAPPDATSSPRRLADIALARSGDKGRHANIGVIARQPSDFDRLRQELTVERVASYLGIDKTDRIERFEVPNLSGLNFLIRDILNPLRMDAQGKALGQVLLQMPLGE
jgi:hypothetical protein